MKNTLLLIFAIALSTIAKSQTDEELLKLYLFNKVEISSPLVEDPIVVIETTNVKVKNIIIFVQGSGNMSVGLKKKKPDVNKEHPYDQFVLFPPVDIYDYWDNYRFVVISKPDVPLFQTYEDYENGGIHNKKFRTEAFLKKNNLNYYAKETSAVIDYYKNQDKDNNIILVGHSQGYHVVAKTATMRQDKISKVVCMSANPLGRNIEFTRKNRLEEYIAKDTTGVYQAKIEKINEGFAYLKNNTSELDQEHKNEYTFIEHASIDDVLELNMPVRIVYGSADVMSWDNDIIPIFASRLNKTNISTKVYVGYGHNYEVKIEGEKTQWHWDEVFKDVIGWIESDI